MCKRALQTALVLVAPAIAAVAADEAWFGAPIPASGEDGREDCGMTAARVFDAPIAGLEKIGMLAVPKSSDLPETSNTSIGFECLDRGLFDPDRCYDTLAAAGVKWARCQTMWSRCEKQKGVYDFTVLDGVVDNLTRRGIRPWFCVTFGNTLYMTNCFTGAAVGCVPTLYGEECRAAWCSYVRELAKRYKGKVTHWEIWNEPNIKHFWQPSQPNAAEYLALVKLTGGVIREEIPDAKIGGTTCSPALNKWETDFFELGGASAIDFWCGHAYARVPERLRKQQRLASGSSADYVTVLKDVRAFIDAHGGKHVDIWQGESGFPSWFPAGHWLWWPKSVCKEGWQSQANQAKWLLRRFVTDRRAGIVRSSFFQMADISRHYSMALTTQTHPAEHGIVNGWTYRPKMSCHAFGHYNALLATARHDESVAVSVTPASDAGAPTVATTFRAASGAPLFLYYTAFDFSGAYTGTCYTARCDAKLTVPAALAPKEPVLVDMLRGGVHAVSSRAETDGHVTYANLPLVDYPLVLCDRSAVKLEAPRIFPFAMEGENLPELWTLTRMREGRNLRPNGERVPAGTGGFLTAKGSDFVDESGRVRRFFGVNLYGPATLPEKADAPAMAERLARWGINAVRIFPQYTWQRRADKDFSKGIDPDLLDRFDWLFFQLKQRGISADMNLHSARTAGYRFKDFVQTVKENKGLDNFDPTFILHQKEFIRTVFNHVNPYTGLAYRDDPAVMTWEINNECSLASSWFRWDLEGKLTPYFRRELGRQFCGWLRAKYGTTARLREAWVLSAPLEPDVLPPDTWKDAAAFARAHWYTEGYENGKAPKDYSFDPTKGLVRIDATKVRKFALVGVPLKDGQPYTVSFRIRSEEPGTLGLSVGQHERPWGNQGCRRIIQTGRAWQEIRVRSAALVTDADNRIQVWFKQKGVYELAGLSFVPGGELGLDPGETLEDGTVGLDGSRSAARTRDLSTFILDVEDRYWKEMYGFVKNEMGAHAPVNCGTADYGAHYPQAYGDFIDDHFYFGGLCSWGKKPWDRSDWYCMNRAMVKEFDVKAGRRPMQHIFENRVFGKPFTISEANMMGQMTTAADFFPITLSVAAFQNSAAFHAYTWSHNSEHSYGSKMFLDMRGNAKYLTHLPASVNMFVRGDVKSGEAESARIAYEFRRAEERNAIIETDFARSTHIQDTDLLACLKAATGRVLVDLPERRSRGDRPTEGGAPVETSTGTDALPRDRATVSSTGEICWNATKSGEEWYAVDTPRTKFLSAFGPAGTAHVFADGSTVTLGDTLMGWAAISFTELSPGKHLLAATGYQQASGAKLAVYGKKNGEIRPEDGVTTFGQRITTMAAMGDLPYVCEGVRATIRIPAAGAVRVTPLDGNARPLGESFDVQVKDGFAEFLISEKYRTVWYLVEKRTVSE